MATELGSQMKGTFAGVGSTNFTYGGRSLVVASPEKTNSSDTISVEPHSGQAFIMQILSVTNSTDPGTKTEKDGFIGAFLNIRYLNTF